MSLKALILAGGKSSRMGSDKAALKYHGIEQVCYLAKILKPFVVEVYVSLRIEQLEAAYIGNLKTITDNYNSPSPLNGIVSAMDQLPKTSWLVVAVDMPNITPQTIKKLIDNRDKAKAATCFEMPVKGGPEPLFAIWESNISEQLRDVIKNTKDHVCPRSVLKSLDIKVIKIAPEVLTNINTPEELEIYKRSA